MEFSHGLEVGRYNSTKRRAAARGLSMLDPAVAGTVLQDLVSSIEIRRDLTERELEVLRLLAHGRTN